MNFTPNEKGESTVEIGGTPYLLAFDIHAMAFAEDYVESVTGRTVGWDEIERRAMSGVVRYIIAVFYAALRKHHRDITAARAAELVFESMKEGAEAARAIREAAKDTRPDRRDVDEMRKGQKPSRPTKARGAKDGTGGVSS